MESPTFKLSGIFLELVVYCALAWKQSGWQRIVLAVEVVNDNGLLTGFILSLVWVSKLAVEVVNDLINDLLDR